MGLNNDLYVFHLLTLSQVAHIMKYTLFPNQTTQTLQSIRIQITTVRLVPPTGKQPTQKRKAQRPPVPKKKIKARTYPPTSSTNQQHQTTAITAFHTRNLSTYTIIVYTRAPNQLKVKKCTLPAPLTSSAHKTSRHATNPKQLKKPPPLNN